MDIGKISRSSGSYNLIGSGLLWVQYEVIGLSGTGSFVQSSGTHEVQTELDIGGLIGSSSNDYTLSGSGLLLTDVIIGRSGSGTFTQSGGTNSVAGALVLGEFDGSSGTNNLNGGLLALSAAGIAQGNGSATFNFSGGTLQGGSGFSSSVPIVLSTAGSDAVFDIAGGTMRLSGPLSGPERTDQERRGSADPQRDQRL